MVVVVFPQFKNDVVVFATTEPFSLSSHLFKILPSCRLINVDAVIQISADASYEVLAIDLPRKSASHVPINYILVQALLARTTCLRSMAL